MKKRILIILACILFAIVAIVGFGYYKSFKMGDSILKIEEFKIEKSEVKLGEKIAVSATFYSSWQNTYFSDEVISSTPFQNKEIVFDGIGFGKLKWKYNISFIPFKNGDIELGKIEILNKNGEGIKYKLPKVFVHPMDLKDENLVLAGEVTETPMKSIKSFWKKHKVIIIICSIIVLILLVYLIYLWKRNHKPISVIIPIWEIALNKVSDLETQLKKDEIDNKKAISELTDIARIYLEKRFNLHSTSETTEEFLRTLHSEESPLSDNHKDFLQKFMSSAELIKFANIAAEINIITDAINNANILIKETIPDQE